MSYDMDEELRTPEVRRAYEENLLVGEARATIGALLASHHISQKELARRLSVSEGRVSQILGGAENLTLRSLAAIAWALGLRFRLDPMPFADRQGTPAQSDPPSPWWLDRLRPTRPAEFVLIAESTAAANRKPREALQDNTQLASNERGLAA